MQIDSHVKGIKASMSCNKGTKSYMNSCINQFVISSYASFSNKDDKCTFGCTIFYNRAWLIQDLLGEDHVLPINKLKHMRSSLLQLMLESFNLTISVKICIMGPTYDCICVGSK